MSSRLLFTVLGLASLLAAAAARADLPRQISFQGRLASATNDSPVTGQTVSIKFTLYDTSTVGTGTPCYTETLSVYVKDGLFNVNIGATSARGVTGLTDAGVPAKTDGGVLLGCDFSVPYWLELNVNNEGAMSPRAPLSAAAYALRADVANRALTVDVAPQANVLTSATGVPSAWSKIGETVLTADGQINLTDIPAYDNLKLEFSLATTSTAADWVFIEFNWDASAAYSSVVNCVWQAGDYPNSSVTYGAIGIAPAASSGRWLVGDAHIGNRPNEIKQLTSHSAFHVPGVIACNNLGSVQYANVGVADSGVPAWGARIVNIRMWSNPNTPHDAGVAGTNFKAGSRVTLFGR
ncbi:MAG TPA: hypothetical protein VGQ83_15445 [Polyangia bacterium]